MNLGILESGKQHLQLILFPVKDTVLSERAEHSPSKTTTKGFQSWNFALNKGIKRDRIFAISFFMFKIYSVTL